MFKIFTIIGCILFIFSCKEGKETETPINYAALHNSGINKMRPVYIQLDTIRIYTGEGDALSSMMGYFSLINDTLRFADVQLASILQYDLQGKFINSRLQRGRGPNEILALHDYTLFPNHHCAILDGNGYVYIFNPAWKKINQCDLIWYKNKTLKQIDSLKKSADANEFAIYGFEYEGVNIKPWGNRHLIVPVNVEHPNFNAYMGNTANYYYKNVATLGIVDTDSGRLHQLLCPRPPVYLQYKYIPNFRHVIFDVDEDTLYFSFQVDSLIYKMTLPKGKGLKAYGFAGKNMRTDYRTTTTFDESDKNYTEDRATFGYYSHLIYIPETRFLFRGYQKGNNSPVEGVQVYLDNKLIYDFDVPKGFKIFGYRKPYYYAQGMPDYDREEMIVYKFQLKEKQ